MMPQESGLLRLWCGIRQRLAAGFSGFVQGDVGSDVIGQMGVVLPGGKVQSLACGGQRFGKPPCFGIGGSERVEHVRLPAVTELLRPLGILDRLGAVAQRRLGAGRPQPCQVVMSVNVAGLDFAGLLIMGQRFIEPAPSRRNDTQGVVDHRVVRLDFQNLPIVGHRFVQSAKAHQGIAQAVVGVGIIGGDLQDLPIMIVGLSRSALRHQQAGEIVVGLGVIRLDGHGLLKLRQGLVEPPTVGQNLAQIVMGLGVAGTDL